MGDEALGKYMHRGGREGRDRLAVMGRVFGPTTDSFLDRLGDIAGWTAVDAACGGGYVSFELARRVGPTGSVIGLDLDADQLALTRADAEERGIGNVRFEVCQILDAWPVQRAQLVYARFILTHLAQPIKLLRRAFEALSPGGTVLVEDNDFTGHSCEPRSAAFDRYWHLYVEASKRRGGDPFIGPKLPQLLTDAGFVNVEHSIAQPSGRTGGAKILPSLTLSIMSHSLIADGLAKSAELEVLKSELDAYHDRTDTHVAMPRMFQIRGTRP
jgi:SAM-dependent methyltransferase